MQISAGYSPSGLYRKPCPCLALCLLLELAIIADFFETHWVERLESAVTTTGHVIQNLWNSSIRVGDLLFCADGSRYFDRFQNFAHMEKLRRASRRKLKNIVAKYRYDAV